MQALEAKFVGENPQKQPGLHDQAREVFQESKKLSSSSIPKDSGFFFP